MLVIVHEATRAGEVVRMAGAPAGTELALCLVHGPDGASHLSLQQQMTVQLRATLGPAAESIATFVVSGLEGDDVESCATGWGADEIVDLDARP